MSPDCGLTEGNSESLREQAKATKRVLLLLPLLERGRPTKFWWFFVCFVGKWIPKLLKFSC